MYAILLNNEFGYKISTTTLNSELGIIESNDNFKYVYKCKKCGELYQLNRKTKFVQNYENFECGVCGGSFIKIK